MLSFILNYISNKSHIHGIFEISVLTVSTTTEISAMISTYQKKSNLFQYRCRGFPTATAKASLVTTRISMEFIRFRATAIQCHTSPKKKVKRDLIDWMDRYVRPDSTPISSLTGSSHSGQSEVSSSNIIKILPKDEPIANLMTKLVHMFSSHF